MRNSALKGLLKKTSRTSPLEFAGEMEAAVSGLSRSQRALARRAAYLGVELAESTDWEYKEPVRPVRRRRRRGSNQKFLQALRTDKGLQKAYRAHIHGGGVADQRAGGSGKFNWKKHRTGGIISIDNT